MSALEWVSGQMCRLKCSFISYPGLTVSLFQLISTTSLQLLSACSLSSEVSTIILSGLWPLYSNPLLSQSTPRRPLPTFTRRPPPSPAPPRTSPARPASSLQASPRGSSGWEDPLRTSSPGQNYFNSLQARKASPSLPDYISPIYP